MSLSQGSAPKDRISDEVSLTRGCAQTIYSVSGRPSAEGLMRATFGRGRYQRTALLVLGSLYIACCPVVTIQAFVIERIANDERFPEFTKTSISNCQTMLFVGWSISFLLVSPLMDKIGRKVVWVVTAILVVAVICNALAPSTGSLAFYSATLFFMGTGCMAATFSYVFLCESVPGSWHSTLTVVLNVLYSVALGLCAFCYGNLTNHWDWRAEYLIWFTPLPIIGVLGALLLHEPLYFLITNRHWEGAEKVLAGIARTNGVTCPFVAWPGVEGSVVVSEHDAKPSPLREISKGPMLRRTAASAVTWTAASLGFYGLGYSAGSLSDNMYTNTELFALADIAGNVVPLFMIPLLGRRGTQISAFIGAAVLLFACGVLPKGSPLLVACSVGGRLCLDIAFCTVYILAVECFPTSCRTTALGICNFVARMLGLAAPVLGNLPASVSCPIFATLCLLGAGATMVLPVTGAGSLDGDQNEPGNLATGLLGRASEMGSAAGS